MEVFQRCKKTTRTKTFKILLCNVPGIETIIKIFQIGCIPTGFSERGSCIQMQIHILIHTHKLFFPPRSQHNMEELVEWNISEEQYYFGSLLRRGCSPFILKTIYFSSLLFFQSYYLPQGFCGISPSVAHIYVLENKNRWLYRLKKNDRSST